MKTIKHDSLRRTLAGFAAALVIGALFAAPARADMYRMALNPYPPGTPAPYSKGGGIPIQPYESATASGTNVTLSWYTLPCYYSVLARENLGPWQSVASGLAISNAWSVTLGMTNIAESFTLAISNSYVGQQNCSSCHLNHYTGWNTTEHASALSALVNAGSGNNASCLPCHTVGFGQPTGYANSTLTPNLANVGCEDCHGAAGWHKTYEQTLIKPAVSLDPAICGSCHQGHNPQYNEYTNSAHYLVDDAVNYGQSGGVYYPNTTVLNGVTNYGYYVTDNGLITNAAMGIVNSTNIPGSGVDSGQDAQVTCGICHSAAARMAMLNDYTARLGGVTNALALPTANDASAWGPTCAVCHDPHGLTPSPVFTLATNAVPGVGTNTYMALAGYHNYQLRNPVWSSNYYAMPSIIDKRYNALGNPYYMGTAFASAYNTNINICGQCHNTGGARWDGLAYGLITNTTSGIVTNNIEVQLFTNVTYTQIFTNTVPPTTNTYTYQQSIGWVATNVVANVTNQAITVGLAPSANAFSQAPHGPQYNMLIGILQPDYLNTTNGKTIYGNGLTNGLGIYATHSGILPRGSYNTNQCMTCHVPSYAGPSGNVTGHSFHIDPNGCALGGCHTSGAPDYIDYGIENSNVVVSMADLLNSWATNNGPAIFPGTYNNYQQNSWEYTTPGGLGSSITAQGPSATDQLLLPTNILQARFDVYMVYADGTYETHNPTLIPLLLKDAETKVMSQFQTAKFTAKSTYGAPKTTTFVFTNLNPSVTAATWNFGDGVATNTTAITVNHVYTNTTSGAYTVTLTATDANGTQTMTRNSYIHIYALPTAPAAFSYTGTLTKHPTTVIFTNTTSNANFGAWSFYLGPVVSANKLGGKSAPITMTQFFTFTNAGIYNVVFSASNPGGSVGVTNSITVN